jgi:recombinational DNA repair protein (RecF pathway)
MKQSKTEGIILDTTDVFDADRSLLVLTRELGKIRARAKGVRRPSSRLAGHLLPYLPTQLELVQTGEWYLVTQAALRLPAAWPPSSAALLDRPSAEGGFATGGRTTGDGDAEERAGGMYPESPLPFLQAAELIAEVVNGLLPDHSPHPVAYDGLRYTLERLRQKNDRFIPLEYFVKLLDELGLGPETGRCVLTGEPLADEPLAWNSQLGGALRQVAWRERGHTESGHVPGVTIPLEQPRSVLVLRQLLRPQFVGERLEMSPAIRREVFLIVTDFLQTQLGRPLKALPFWQDN